MQTKKIRSHLASAIVNIYADKELIIVWNVLVTSITTTTSQLRLCVFSFLNTHIDNSLQLRALVLLGTTLLNKLDPHRSHKGRKIIGLVDSRNQVFYSRSGRVAVDHFIEPKKKRTKNRMLHHK